MGRSSGIPRASTPVEILSLNAWTADFKTEYEDVTSFGDVNRVYIPGMKDAGGHAGRLLQLRGARAVRGGRTGHAGRAEAGPEQHGGRRSSGAGRPTWTRASTRACRRRRSPGTWKAAGPFLLEGGVLSATAAEAARRDAGAGRAQRERRARAATSRPRDVFESLTITGGAGAVLWGARVAVEADALADRADQGRGRRLDAAARRSRGSISFTRARRRCSLRRRGRRASGCGRSRRSRSGRRVYGHHLGPPER